MHPPQPLRPLEQQRNHSPKRETRWGEGKKWAKAPAPVTLSAGVSGWPTLQTKSSFTLNDAANGKDFAVTAAFSQPIKPCFYLLKA